MGRDRRKDTPKPKPKTPLVMPRLTSTVLIGDAARFRVTEEIAVDFHYQVGRSNGTVRVLFKQVDADEFGIDKQRWERHGHHSHHAIVMIRAKPDEPHFSKREIYRYTLCEVPKSFPVSFDIRQDVIDAIKAHWKPAPDWQEEYPEGLPLMVSAVQLSSPASITAL